MSSTDFEDTLRRGLRDLAAHAPEAPMRAPADRIAAYPAPEHQRSLPRILTVCAAVVVVAGLIALLVRDGGDDTPVVTDSTIAPTTTSIPTTTTGAPAISTGAVAAIPAGPGYGSLLPAMVWTGDELIIWGGEVISEQEWSGRGGAYDPTTGTWRELASSPLPPMSEQTAVWTGDEMIVCCGRIPTENGVKAAAYRPATDTWRTIAAPPFDRAPFAQSVWTGTEMIVTGGSDYRGAAAYDPASDSWRTLTSPPGVIERTADSAWTGELMVLWDGSSLEAFTYRPRTDTWERLPAVPEELGLTGGTGTVVGNELIVWGARQRQGPEYDFSATGAALDLGGRTWRPLPDAQIDPGRPDEGTRTSPSSVSTGSEMLVFAGSLGGGSDDTRVPVLAYDPASGTWRTLGTAPRGYRAPLIWADGRAFLLGNELLSVTL